MYFKARCMKNSIKKSEKVKKVRKGQKNFLTWTWLQVVCWIQKYRKEVNNMKKMLIVYYSWSNGNTEKIAKELQAATGADIAKIETETPYTGSYNDVVSLGQDEVNRGYMRPIKPLGVNIADYDVNPVWQHRWSRSENSSERNWEMDWDDKKIIIVENVRKGRYWPFLIH